MANFDFDPIWATLLPKMLRWQRNLKVNGAPCLNSDDGCTIFIPPQRNVATWRDSDEIDIFITGNTQDGTNKRWKYSWAEAVLSTAGYTGWTTKSGGRTGSSTDYDYAYNRIEVINGASGAYGNGVSSTNLTGTFDIKPIPNGIPIRAKIITPDDESKPSLWFAYANGVDGAC